MKKAKRYNVLCTTRMSKDGNAPWSGHMVDEVAEVFSSYKKEHGVNVVYTTVRFQGREHELLCVRPGFNDLVTTLVIAREDPPYDSLELHTDTPMPGVSMSEVIRQMMTSVIKFHGNRWGLV